MNDRNCRSCAYWSADPRPEKGGLCRASLPILSPGIDADDEQGVWPVTTEYDWCAHHKLAVPTAASGDTRPGVAVVEIQDNGIVTITHHSGDSFELSALEGLTEADAKALDRMVWSKA